MCSSLMRSNRMLGLYIHIPFCVRKCRYCDFLSAPACDSEREAYLKSLHGQIKAIGERLRQKKSGKHYIVDSIFIGGGTPSLLSSDQMQALMDVVQMMLKLLLNVILALSREKSFVHTKKQESIA